jgi:hypothetical protein
MSIRALRKRLDVIDATQEANFIFVVINRPPRATGANLANAAFAYGLRDAESIEACKARVRVDKPTGGVFVILAVAS